MALQTSGAISISQIKTELGISDNSLRALSSAAGKSTPDAMSEFYGYSAGPPAAYFSGDFYGTVNTGYEQGDTFVQYGSFGVGANDYPFYGYIYWRLNFDRCDYCDFYGSRSDFPSIGSLDIFLGKWPNTDTSYIDASSSGVPTGYSYFNWTTAYYIGDVAWFDFHGNGFDANVGVPYDPSGIVSARMIAEYELL